MFVYILGSIINYIRYLIKSINNLYCLDFVYNPMSVHNFFFLIKLNYLFLLHDLFFEMFI